MSLDKFNKNVYEIAESIENRDNRISELEKKLVDKDKQIIILEKWITKLETTAGCAVIP
jgi:predicted RNase H-like nuclease (RuvC/YqgF family)